MALYFGIDVSSYQGTIDFAKVKKEHSFVILKSTMKDNTADKKFETYYKNAKANGLNIGAYKYVYATNSTTAKAEANALVKLFANKTLNCGVWLDMEDSSIKTLGKAVLTQIIETETKILNDNGYEVGIYCSEDWYKNVLDSTYLKNHYNFWIARYGTNDGTMQSTYEPSSHSVMWQYTSKGKVDGIDGNVDLNVAFKDLTVLYSKVTGTTTSTYYPKYTGDSTKIDEILKAVGVPYEYYGSVAKRKPLAKVNGITNYSGTASQNIKLKQLAKNGTLKRI